MKKYTRILLFTLLFASSCKKSGSGGGADPCTGISPKFAADVQPIVNSTCAISSGCHAAGSTNAGGPFTDYTKIFNRRTDIKDQINAGLMPQTGSLTTDQKNKIICWINSGA